MVAVVQPVVIEGGSGLLLPYRLVVLLHLHVLINAIMRNCMNKCRTCMNLPNNFIESSPVSIEKVAKNISEATIN